MIHACQKALIQYNLPQFVSAFSGSDRWLTHGGVRVAMGVTSCSPAREADTCDLVGFPSTASLL